MTSSSMTDAMDLGLPDGVSGARVQMHQEPVYFVIWTSRGAEVCEACRGGRRGPGLGPGGLGLIGGILRNPFDSQLDATKPARWPRRSANNQLTSFTARRDRALLALRVASRNSRRGPSTRRNIPVLRL